MYKWGFDYQFGKPLLFKLFSYSSLYLQYLKMRTKYNYYVNNDMDIHHLTPSA